MFVARVPGLENLNADVLRETVGDLRNLGLAEPSEVEFALAQTIIINSLGGEFWAKECTSCGEKQAFFGHKHDVRVVHLAHMLWCIKDSHGFRDFLSKNDRNRFESTYYECTAAHWFLKSSASIQFVVPRGERGADFDIVVNGFSMGLDLNVEVKARSASFSTEKQVRNYLGSHRSQLPANGGGVIFCKLERPELGIGQQALVEETRTFILGTSRIVFVVYCWDAASQANAIALQYLAVDSFGRMGSIFPAATKATIPEFMRAAGL